MAFAPFLPELGFAGRWGTTSSDLSPGAVNITGGLFPSGNSARQFSQGELQLQWTVWDFGRRAGQYGQAVSHERIAQLQLVRLRQTVTFDVTSAYLGVLLAQASRRVQEQSIRSAEAILKDTQVRRKGGVADLDTVLRADVQLSESREALVGAQQAEFDALARLNYTMGRNASLPLRLVDWTSRPRFERSLPECLQTAAAQRREVAIAREAVTAAQHALGAAEADFYPRIYARGTVGHVDGSGILTGWQEGAAIHLDQGLFLGGRREGQQRMATADVGEAAAHAQAIFDGITLEVNLAYRTIAATRERIRLAETTIAQARENLRLIRVKYQNGNATPTDIVDAETTATRSEQRFWSAVYDYLTALARLEYALGTPQEYLVEQSTAAPDKDSKQEQLPPPRPLPGGDKAG